MVVHFSKLYGLNPYVVLAVIGQESGGNPYAIRVNGKHGKSYIPDDYKEAVRIAYRYGDNIDLGYMQVNYKWWGKRLGLSKWELLIPKVNIQAGCYILYLMLKKYGNYTEAVAHYHSSNYYRGMRYARSVAYIYKQLTE